MNFLRNYLFKIAIIFILLSSGIICIYTFQHYEGTGTIKAVQNASGFENKPDTNRTYPGKKMQSVESRSPSTNTDSATSASKRPNSDNTKNVADQLKSSGKILDLGNKVSSVTIAYSPLLLVYALAFFGMCAVAWYFLIKKKAGNKCNLCKTINVFFACHWFVFKNNTGFVNRRISW